MYDELETRIAAETLEPLDSWVHLQPSADEEKRGRIYLPAAVGDQPIQRAVVLAVGDDVEHLSPGDVVFALVRKMIDLRDGSRLAPREAIVARVAA